MWSKLSAGSLCAAILALSCPASADDENVYFTAQGGRAFTNYNGIRDVGGSFEPGTTASNPDLKDSTFYGAKMGVYSRRGILGLEAEVFRTRPDPKYQTQTFFEPTFGPYPQTRGGNQRVTTWALNLVGRVPLTERLVAHAGIGPALIRSNLQFDNEQEQSSNRLGLNTQLGLTYFITKQIQVSAEWKYNAARMNYPTHGTTEGFNTDYRTNLFALGISYAFDWASPWRFPSLRSNLGMQPANIGPK